MSRDSTQSTSCKNDCIIFDLDETLINTKQRHYHILCDYINDNKLVSIKYKEYLNQREKGLRNVEIISLIDPMCKQSFEHFWKKNIELSHYLDYDKVIVNTSLLRSVKHLTQSHFILISLRSDKNSATEQFSNFPFTDLFEEVYFLNHSPYNNPKTEIIKEIKKKYQVIFFTGDANADKEAADKNNITFCALSSGWKHSERKTYRNINDLLKEKFYVLGKK